MRVLITEAIRRKAAFLIEREEEDEEKKSESKSSVPVPASTSPEVKAISTEYDLKDKGYRPMPKIKPPRRQHFNKTDEKGYRKEYQREYRAENGRKPEYIKKNKG